MPKYPALIGGLTALLLISIGSLAFAQASEKFKTRLSLMPIDAAMMATGTMGGSGSVSAELTGSTVTIAGAFEGFASPARAARLHQGPRAVRGPAFLDLVISKATSGTIRGSVQLTSLQIDDLKNGRIYVQIDCEKTPTGNLWGWLVREESR